MLTVLLEKTALLEKSDGGTAATGSRLAGSWIAFNVGLGGM